MVAEGHRVEIELELSRRIAAPASRCWELITAPERAPEWITIVSEATAEGEPGLGRVIHARGGLLGVHASTTQTVHLWQPERRYGWRGEDPFPLVIECTLDEEADRSTVFHVRAAAAPGRFLAVGRRVLHRTVRTQLSRSADRFQQLVEAG
jgi:uncharacterized protein YndB with AHSA1/START domain